MKINFHIVSRLILSTLCFLLLNSDSKAQDEDVCEEAGYFLSFDSGAPECPGDATGTATVATPGCYCMFSGCTYDWSNGGTFHTIVDLEPGMYEVTVTHPNGCILTGSVEVPSATGYLASEEVQHIECKGENNGKIKINPFTNYEGFLSYEWSNGATTKEITGLSAGNYNVTVTNFDGCDMILYFTITEPEESLDFEYEVSPSCSGMDNGEIAVSIDGGVPPYSILCDGIESPESIMNSVNGGLHSVMVRDANDCVKEVEVMVEEIPLEVPEITASNSSICEGSHTSLSAFGGGSGLSYEWIPQDGISNPYSNLVTASPAVTTTYTLEVSNSEGCKGSREYTIEVKSCNSEEEEVNTGVEDLPVEQQINIHPIPANTFIMIEFDPSFYTDASVAIMDLSGRTLDIQQSIQNRMDISHLQNGIYFMKVQQGNQFLVKKFIKR